MLKSLRHHHISFKHAFDGLIYAFSSQPNFRIHAFFSAVAVVGGIILNISSIEMLIIIFTILLGMTVEMINTSIESVTDLISKEWSLEAKIAKDVSAGMMLLIAMGAVLVSIYIFVPKIFGLLNFQ
jgi:diacylglycerol kinase (ATP)